MKSWENYETEVTIERETLWGHLIKMGLCVPRTSLLQPNRETNILTNHCGSSGKPKSFFQHTTHCK